MQNSLPEGFEILEPRQPSTVEPAAQQAPLSQLPEGFVPIEEALTPVEKLKGGLEAVGRGLITRPGVALVQKALGVAPEESKFREVGLGKAATALEIAGLAAPAVASLGATAAARAGVGVAAKAIAPLATLGEFTQAGLLSKAGQAAVKGLGVKGAVAAPAVAMGVENAIFAAADETAKAIEGNPNTAQKALYNVALSGIVGSATGGALGKVGDLWKTKFTPKYKAFTEDFVGRMKDHARGAIPAVEAVGPELQNIVNSADEATGLITGAQGLKRQEVAKLLPEIADQKVTDQASKAFSDVSDYLEKVTKEPGTYRTQGTRMIREARDRMLDEITKPGATAADVFFALDNFKQQIGPLGKFDPRFMGAAQKPGTSAINDLYGLIKNNLEDEAVWGLAARRQKEINQAASKFFKTVKDLKTVAMSKGPNGEWIVNPDKLNTLINQAKKGRAEVKQNILNNFLDSVEHLYDTIDKIDNKFGVSSGVERPAMTASRAVTQKLTPGMKAADFLSLHAVDAASEAGGLALGHEAAKAVGLKGMGEWLGTMFGHYQIKPIIKTVLPVLAKPLTTIAANGSSVRAASQLVNAVVNGENVSRLAADALFLKDKAIPLKSVADRELEKIDKKAREIQSNPESLLELNDDLGQLLPDHSFSLAGATINALNYINQKRPGPKKNGVLDKEILPSKQQMAKFKRTLEVAQNPLVILKRAKEGTLQSSDVVDAQSMYPDLYNDMVKKVTASMISHLSTGEQLPYRLKKSLSLLAATPLDTNFSPQSIMAAQSVFMKNNVPQGQQLPAVAPKTSRKSQLPSLTETDSQRRILSR